MTFRDDCRHCGGVTQINPVKRICGVKPELITTCDGCEKFESNHQPCEECGLFLLCKKAGKQIPKD